MVLSVWCLKCVKRVGEQEREENLENLIAWIWDDWLGL